MAAHIPPNGPLNAKALQIGSPIAARPAQTLLQVLHVIFQGGLDLALFVELDPCLVIVVDHPARQEVVVVSI